MMMPQQKRKDINSLISYKAGYNLCSKCNKSIYAFSHSKTYKCYFQVLKYLKQTPGKGLLFQKTDKRGIEGFVDADWTGYIKDGWLTSGYYTKVWENVVTRRSKKQQVSCCPQQC